MGEERGRHIWRGPQHPRPIKKQHRAEALHPGLSWENLNFSCFLEPGQGSPDFSSSSHLHWLIRCLLPGGQGYCGEGIRSRHELEGPSRPRPRPCGSVWRPSSPQRKRTALPSSFADPNPPRVPLGQPLRLPSEPCRPVFSVAQRKQPEATHGIFGPKSR